MFGYLDIKRVYGQKFNALVRELESNRLENDIVHSDAALEKQVKGSTDYLMSEAASTKENGEKRIVLIDMLILLSGTFIWGFGDLLI